MASPLQPLHIFSERYNSILVRLVPEGELTNGIKNHTPLLRTKYSLQINVNKSDEQYHWRYYLPGRISRAFG